MFDVIVVGGSSAGLSAALTLGRARRKTLVFDDGQPCNRFSHASHGFLTRDGVAPGELLQIAREQLHLYNTVEFCAGTVQAIASSADGFEVETAAGDHYAARKVLLATGLKDVLPAIPGIEALWGSSVFHCPYCDGWEVRDQPLVVMGSTPATFHQTMMVHHWSPHLTLCTNADWNPSPEQRQLLDKNGISLNEKPIARVEGENGQIQQIVFADGSALSCKAMFIHPEAQHRTPFAEMLGCAVNEQNRVQVDVLGRTSVSGVYAAGDLANPMRSIAASVAQGAAAGAGINYDLIVEDFH